MWRSIKQSLLNRPLVWLAILALALVFARIIYHSWAVGSIRLHFLFLPWNLFLAAVPLLLSNWLRQRQRSGGIVVITLIIWLLFFPNAPYLLTDFVHLRPKVHVALWYDALLLGVYSLLGIWLALRSLEQVRLYLLNYWGIWMARCLVVLTLGLSGLGIYLGRVLRWNSWDAFLNPLGPVQDALGLLAHPLRHRQAWALIIVFSLGLSTVYALVHRRVLLSAKRSK